MAPLPAPDLIIQDELHLIAGPLGTMAGLYETVIEALAVRQVGGRTIKPKTVASTATARRAQDQVQALFARPATQVFPPPGPDRRNTFFARTVLPSETPARLSVGIASQGRNPKVLMRRVLLALMGAAAHAWHEAGGDGNPQNPADPYMTTLAYFNSLRELGGARRIPSCRSSDRLIDRREADALDQVLAGCTSTVAARPAVRRATGPVGTGVGASETVDSPIIMNNLRAWRRISVAYSVHNFELDSITLWKTT